MTIILELPWPPSVNHYYRRVVIHGRVATVISKEGREYRERVGEAVLLADAQLNLPGRLGVSIEAYPPDRRKRDMDNLFKAPLDAMEKAGVYADDNQGKKLLIKECDVCRPHGKIIVEITELLGGEYGECPDE